MSFSGKVAVTPSVADKARWTVYGQLTYDAGRRGSITTSPFMLTDGASVPFPLTAFFPRLDRRYFKSVLIHDAALKTRRDLSRNQIDSIFHAALKDEGAGIVTRNLLVGGVRFWGLLVERDGYFRPQENNKG